MDKYYVKARLLPTILTALPLVAVYLFILSPYLAEYLKKILPYLPTVGDISFSVGIVMFLVQVNRTLSKELLQSNYFKGETKMPTTDFLLFSHNEYSTETKGKIRKKIKEHFDMEMFDAQREAADEIRSRFLIKEAVGQIRVLLKDNEMLLNHNIEYGALRNFLGGCIQAVFFSLVLIIKALFFPYDKGLLIVAVIFLVIYGSFLLMSKWLIQKYGNNYARILYQQFLALPKPSANP
ncbi:hypothetical protein [Runella slithyformis]|uniref:Uncharacterized protein n=1 Tax=Runella slithyformis (strain ATCC 29530 / DSM 19594 / LMG 11500 / NCIMB 11436 / LSU 4) TaxID=761193 RepID=A0A7U3ZRQ8_RUNSL|nr:hypothetical protein [Runella slithyformis]AEI52157.1 hypothetical protein Runsl_5861 [Runella slithyformis DSM 19594]